MKMITSCYNKLKLWSYASYRTVWKRVWIGLQSSWKVTSEKSTTQFWWSEAMCHPGWAVSVCVQRKAQRKNHNQHKQQLENNLCSSRLWRQMSKTNQAINVKRLLNVLIRRKIFWNAKSLQQKAIHLHSSKWDPVHDSIPDMQQYQLTNVNITKLTQVNIRENCTFLNDAK